MECGSFSKDTGAGKCRALGTFLKAVHKGKGMEKWSPLLLENLRCAVLKCFREFGVKYLLYDQNFWASIVALPLK